MSEPLTDTELAAIRERVDKATAGPWEIHDCGIWESGFDFQRLIAKVPTDDIVFHTSHTAFIVAARSDVPRLLDEIERLKAIITQHDLCHDLHGTVGPREFADGCAAEQRKLYGCAPDADEVQRLRAENKILKGE